MSVVVISKSPMEVVKPVEQARATGHINLSSYDKMFGPLQVTVFSVFEHPIQDPIDTIKRGLSRALFHYYPIAGCIAPGVTPGEPVIKCTGQGVMFVAASANCAMKDVADLGLLKEELGVFYPEAADVFRYLQPLVMIQVTVFSCGGFVVGVTCLHAGIDGLGLGQFMQAVGELTRGLPHPSVVPVRSEDSLTCGVSSSFSTSLIQFMSSLRPSTAMAVQDMTVPLSLINRIRDEYSSTSSSRQPCSVFAAVAAVLWRCRSRAIMSDPEALDMLVFMVNARKHTGAKVGYYGNCVTMRLVTTTSGAVANGSIMDLVKMIHDAKNRVPEMDEVRQLKSWYNIFTINSVRDLRFEAQDFGAGTPARMMWHWPDRGMLPQCTACIPCNQEYTMLSSCVMEEHAGAFAKELANMDLVYNRLSASSKL